MFGPSLLLEQLHRHWKESDRVEHVPAEYGASKALEKVDPALRAAEAVVENAANRVSYLSQGLIGLALQQEIEMYKAIDKLAAELAKIKR